MSKAKGANAATKRGSTRGSVFKTRSGSPRRPGKKGCLLLFGVDVVMSFLSPGCHRRYSGMRLIPVSCAAWCNGTHNAPTTEETWRHCSPQQHKHSCGLDLPATAMSVALFNHTSAQLLQKHLLTTLDAVLRALVSYQEELVVGVACLFTWEWLADR